MNRILLFFALIWKFSDAQSISVEANSWPQIVGASLKYNIDTLARAIESAKVIDLTTPYELITNPNKTAVGSAALIDQFLHSSTQQVLIGLWQSVYGMASTIAYSSDNIYVAQITAYVDPTLTVKSWDPTYPAAIGLAEYATSCPSSSSKNMYFWKADSKTGLATDVNKNTYSSQNFCTISKPWFKYANSTPNFLVFSESTPSSTTGLNMFILSYLYKSPEDNINHVIQSNLIFDKIQSIAESYYSSRMKVGYIYHIKDAGQNLYNLTISPNYVLVATSLGVATESIATTKTVEQASNYYIKQSFSVLKSKNVHNSSSEEIIESGDMVISKILFTYGSAPNYQLKLMFVSVSEAMYKYNASSTNTIITTNTSTSTTIGSDDSNDIKDTKTAAYAILGLVVPIFFVAITHLYLFLNEGKATTETKIKSPAAMSKQENL